MPTAQSRRRGSSSRSRSGIAVRAGFRSRADRFAFVEQDAKATIAIAPPDRVERRDLSALRIAHRTAAQGQAAAVDDLDALGFPAKRRGGALIETRPGFRDRSATAQHRLSGTGKRSPLPIGNL